MRKRRSELWKISDAVQPLVDQFMDLSEEQQAVFLDMVDPLPEEPEPAKATKKTRKKSNKSASKSARGQSISSVIQRTAKVRVDDGDDDDSLTLCQHEFDNGGTCKRTSDHNIHHLQSDSLYHEFDAGKSSAPRAGGKSSTNGAAGNGTVNSGIDSEDVSNAVHAGG